MLLIRRSYEKLRQRVIRCSVLLAVVVWLIGVCSGHARTAAIWAALIALAGQVVVAVMYFRESQLLRQLSTLVLLAITPVAVLVWAYQHGWAWLWTVGWLWMFSSVYALIVTELERLAQSVTDRLGEELRSRLSRTPWLLPLLRILRWFTAINTVVLMIAASAGAPRAMTVIQVVVEAVILLGLFIIGVIYGLGLRRSRLPFSR